MSFVETVVNMSFSNLQNFKKFTEDINLLNIDMEDLISQVNKTNSNSTPKYFIIWILGRNLFQASSTYISAHVHAMRW
jgi:hypothetical protein